MARERTPVEINDCPRCEEQLELPPLSMSRTDYDFVVGALVERGITWEAFAREALIEGASR